MQKKKFKVKNKSGLELGEITIKMLLTDQITLIINSIPTMFILEERK